jgi:hypothetical protein
MYTAMPSSSPATPAAVVDKETDKTLAAEEEEEEEEEENNKKTDLDEVSTLFCKAISLEPASRVMKKTEEIVEKAALHVEQARSQRLFANLKVQQAQSDKEQGKEHRDSSRCFVMDYAHNACVYLIFEMYNLEPPTINYTPLRILIYLVGRSRGILMFICMMRDKVQRVETMWHQW